MNLGLNGQKVIITGAASGIGLATARAFASEGANVMVCDVDPEALAGLSRADPNLHTAHCDVTNRGDVARFMDEALEVLGGLDTLVNNAGIAGPTGAVEDIEPEDWDHCLAVCLTGQFNLTRLAIAPLKDSTNPSITNLSSLAGRLGFALRTPYSAAKWGVIGLTKSLAIELGPHGIRVNAILPGLVAGERQRRVLEAKAQSMGKDLSEVEATALSHTSLRDYVTAEQVADQILFLASERCKSVSGQAISVCGDTQKLA